MKNIIFTLIFAFSFIGLNATIWHVDQNPNKPTSYIKNLQLAINNASSGDTIYIYPANDNYGNITISKKLHLFGFGYNGSLNGVSRIGTITLDTTTSPNSTASGTSIQGLTINHINCSKPNIDNVKIFGNYFYNSSVQVSTNSNGWVIMNNLFKTNLEINYSTNVLISNNVFEGYYCLYYSNSATVSVVNNIFFQWSHFYYVFNASITNNIFLCNYITNQDYMNNNVFTNNLSFRTATDNYNLPPTGNTGSGNISNQSPIFVTGTASGAYNYTLDYHLTASSPGKNAGTDGTDLGQYGGTNPFVWGGAITIPQITEMVITNPVVNQGTNINVKVKAKKADL